MTVAELIEELRKYPPDTAVMVYDNEYGRNYDPAMHYCTVYWSETYENWDHWVNKERKKSLRKQEAVIFFPGQTDGYI